MERFSREFAGYIKIGELVGDLWKANSEKALIEPARPSTLAVGSLYAKGRKGFRATGEIAAVGYGEDGLIIARSLTNLCIDLAYICAAKSDARGRQWVANGRLARRTFLRKFGRASEDEMKIDWAEAEVEADRWRKVKIFDRAKHANLQEMYEVAYALGSSVEHSDAWSAGSYFVGVDGDRIRAQTGPSEQFVDLALLTAAQAFTRAVRTAGKFWQFDFAGRDDEMERIILASFSPEGDRGKGGEGSGPTR